MAMHFALTDMQLMVNVAVGMSLTKGAQYSFLSLPAASNLVKNLEGYLGTALLYRTSQGVTLTPSGEAFVRHARIVLRQLEHLRGDIQEYASGVKGRRRRGRGRSEEHTSELQSLMRISYAVFCLKKKKHTNYNE